MAHSDCFVIFEGGGAKGITHLGALKALEQVGLSKIGIAGASAGAIVAALAAVGFSADDLINVEDHTDILQKREKTPVDLLGAADWSAFRNLPIAGGGRRRTGGGLVLLALPPLVLVWLFSLCRTIGRPALARSAWRVIDTFGFFSTESARDLLNTLIRDKLKATTPDVPDLICFRDIDPRIRPSLASLKVIATNLKRASPELFDRSTPDVVVADAVAASFCIPIFFKPARVRRVDDAGQVWFSEATYADGGLVSNLPVWAFSDDKKAIERTEAYRRGRPIPIVAFRLSEETKREEKGRSPVAGLAAFTGSVVRTGIFGGQSLPQNFVNHLTVIDLPSPLGVLEFDCGRADAEKAHEAGRAAAFSQLQRVYRANPAGRSEGLLAMVAIAKDLSAAIHADADPISQFRACLVRRLGNLSFKIVEGYGMDDDADDDLVLDQNNPGAPTAFIERNFTFVDLDEPGNGVAMTKYERALLRRTLKSVISIPIFNDAGEWKKSPRRRSEPLGVFCLDSDHDLSREYADVAFRSRLAVESVDRFSGLMAFRQETS